MILQRLFRDCFRHFLEPGAGRLFGDSLETPVRGKRGCNENPPNSCHHSTPEEIKEKHPLPTIIASSRSLREVPSGKVGRGAYPLIQNDYRQEKIIFELFSGALQESPVRAQGAITGGALTGQGPIQETIFGGEFFSGALTGKSCKIAPGQFYMKKGLPNYFGNHFAVEGNFGGRWCYLFFWGGAWPLYCDKKLSRPLFDENAFFREIQNKFTAIWPISSYFP